MKADTLPRPIAKPTDAANGGIAPRERTVNFGSSLHSHGAEVSRKGAERVEVTPNSKVPSMASYNSTTARSSAGNRAHSSRNIREHQAGNASRACITSRMEQPV